MKGFGGMVSFEVKGGKKAASRLVEVKKTAKTSEICFYYKLRIWLILRAARVARN